MVVSDPLWTDAFVRSPEIILPRSRDLRKGVTPFPLDVARRGRRLSSLFHRHGLDRAMHLRAVCAVALLLGTDAASAQGSLTDENLIEHVPAGFKAGAQSSSGTSRLTEFVPQNETVDAWSELITTQIFLGQRRRDPAAFLSQVGERWLRSCPGSRPDAIRTGRSNGYIVSMLILRCEQSPRTGHPENTVFRAISGDDSLYLVEYAFRSTLDRASLTKALTFMSTVTVCGARSPEHPCP